MAAGSNAHRGSVQLASAIGVINAPAKHALRRARTPPPGDASGVLAKGQEAVGIGLGRQRRSVCGLRGHRSPSSGVGHANTAGYGPRSTTQAGHHRKPNFAYLALGEARAGHEQVGLPQAGTSKAKTLISKSPVYTSGIPCTTSLAATASPRARSIVSPSRTGDRAPVRRQIAKGCAGHHPTLIISLCRVVDVAARAFVFGVIIIGHR